MRPPIATSSTAAAPAIIGRRESGGLSRLPGFAAASVAEPFAPGISSIRRASESSDLSQPPKASIHWRVESS